MDIGDQAEAPPRTMTRPILACHRRRRGRPGERRGQGVATTSSHRMRYRSRRTCSRPVHPEGRGPGHGESACRQREEQNQIACLKANSPVARMAHRASPHRILFRGLSRLPADSTERAIPHQKRAVRVDDEQGAGAGQPQRQRRGLFPFVEWQALGVRARWVLAPAQCGGPTLQQGHAFVHGALNGVTCGEAHYRAVRRARDVSCCHAD